MQFIIPIVSIIIILFLLYLSAIAGRRNAKGLKKLQGFFYAHRGLHRKPAIPENSLSAFRRAAAKGYGAELDIHLLRDGGLAVFHDSELKRTTGADGIIEDLTTEELKNYTLEASDECIPCFTEVLDIFEDTAPLIIELKTYKGNAKALCEAAFKILDSYKGAYCVESFDPRCLIWLKKNRPDVIRGQLSQNYFKHKSSGLGAVVDFILTNLLSNFLTRPDFIAYRFSDRKNLSNVICTKLLGIQAVSWTIKSKADHDTATREGCLSIFERFEP